MIPSQPYVSQEKAKFLLFLLFYSCFFLNYFIADSLIGQSLYFCFFLYLHTLNKL